MMGDELFRPRLFGVIVSTFPQFPASFEFGTSTASYQIEGAIAADGRGPSIWDTFTATTNNIVDGSSGADACDHYNRMNSDVALMAELGFDAYRFSIAWPRVQPTGSGAYNAAGLDFYDRLVDQLCEHGISPMATLFHWDLPQALEDVGGWTDRDTAKRFGEYAHTIAERIGDRVIHWCPVNEPNVFSMFGYALGIHAPGKQLGFGALGVVHHLLLGHGLATQALRAAGATSVGCATNHQPVWPASDIPEDIAAAEAFEALNSWIFADPMLTGTYPDGFIELMPGTPAEIEADLRVVNQPLDFYGVNYYNPMVVGDPSTAPASADTSVPVDGTENDKMDAAIAQAGIPFRFEDVDADEVTDFGWPVVPAGLTEMLCTLANRYGDALPPVKITENGCSYRIGPDHTGRVADTQRIKYYNTHLSAVAGAMAQGVNVTGYYAWSFMDNFEWAEGYTQRFGLVHIDYETQARTIKDSGLWFRSLIEAQTSRSATS